MILHRFIILISVVANEGQRAYKYRPFHGDHRISKRVKYQKLMMFNEDPARVKYELKENHHHLRHHHDEVPWPVKKEAVVEGDLILGGLMMVHEREESVTCGPIMPQGGIQALEAMLYTLDFINKKKTVLGGIKLGAHILDDCDKDTYGLEMAVDFIKGKP